MLTSLMFEPARWNARFGWRQFTNIEKYANYCFWREVGKLMHLAAIPPSYEECEQYNVDYEASQLKRTRSAVALAAVLFQLLESWVPPPVRPLVKPGLSALVDDSLLACFDAPPAPGWLKWLVPAALRLRAGALRYWPRRRIEAYYIDRPVRSYRSGYRVADLGPPADWR
jgi:hypothetical protein